MGWTDALFGTLFTWAVTALGSALVFVIPSNQDPAMEKKLLDASYGFAGGVMLAASFWSLLVRTHSHNRVPLPRRAWSPPLIDRPHPAALIHVGPCARNGRR